MGQTTDRTHTSPGHTARKLSLLARLTAPLRAVSKAAVFFLKVFPMLPSKAIDWVTPTPVIEKVRYPTTSGKAEGEIYRPPGDGPFPAIVVCLGVVPFGVDHPQVPVLGRALARAGFASLMYWSPAMRDFRLQPQDIDNIALAYEWLIEQPWIDPARSGLLGTCVGGSFALMAAASSRIRERVSFLAVYAPFSSMWTFARDIASASCANDGQRKPWKVDQLTRRVFVQSITAELAADEAEALRAGFAKAGDVFDGRELSAEGEKVHALLTAADAQRGEAALHQLPEAMQEQLRTMSPLAYVADLHVPQMIMLHDAGDQVIPVGESRRLHAALQDRAGVRYTEMNFSHLDPAKGKLPLNQLVRELAKFFAAVYPLFRHSV